MLDMADEKYGENTVILFFNKQTGKTLREIFMADIFEPCEQKDNPPKWKTVVESEKWQNMFKNYQPENLSEKNQEFLTQARRRIETEDEKKRLLEEQK
jgi:hypothetical protein